MFRLNFAFLVNSLDRSELETALPSVLPRADYFNISDSVEPNATVSSLWSLHVHNY